MKQSTIVVSGTALMVILILAGSVRPAGAQEEQIPIIQQRLDSVEEYLKTLQPTFEQFSDQLQNNLGEYTAGLERSLREYSLKLQEELNNRLGRLTKDTVVLAVGTKAYQRVETNSGDFLIAIDDVQTQGEGVRLNLNIGNPNYASYNGFTLKFVWGKRWRGERHQPYDEWRKTLRQAEYRVDDKITKGRWNPVSLDLMPARVSELEHLECTMEVSAIELLSSQ